jgi:hypothetical protein
VDTANRIVERLPRFYSAQDIQSSFFRLLKTFAEFYDESQKELFSTMRSHWIDTAFGIDLDLLGSIFKLKRRTKESDDSLRKRIKFFIAEFTGGGTREAIIAQTTLYLDLKDVAPILIENPPVSQVRDMRVKHGDIWTARSLSINDENVTMTLSIPKEEKNQGGGLPELSDPTIADYDNASNSIKFNGTIHSGQNLIFKQDGTAELDGEDVTSKISGKGLKLIRKGSRWIFQESVSPNIARFDQAVFDQHVYAMFVPTAVLHLEWTARLLAAFEIKVPSEALKNSGVTKQDLAEMINSIKAAGVKAFITLVKNAEDYAQLEKDYDDAPKKDSGLQLTVTS